MNNILELKGLSARTAAKEVYALQNTFASLNKLFFVVSVLISVAALFTCVILLVKLQSGRYREIGLLSALGFNHKNISSMIFVENVMLSAMASAMNLALLLISGVLRSATAFPFVVTALEIALCVMATFVVVMAVGACASYKLIKAEPAEALRK